MNKASKIFLISLPVLLGGGFAYWYYGRYVVPGKKPIPDTNGKLPSTNATVGGATATGSSNSAITNNGCTFPLQVGSNNGCVGQLQDALGVTIDNKFGPNTLAALVEQTGYQSVISASQLDSINETILARDAQGTNGDLASSINTQYSNDNGSLKNFQVVKDTTWKEMVQNANGEWVSAGYQLSMKKGLRLNLKDYLPYDVNYDTGSLVVQCTRGANQGYWNADPNDIVLI